MCAERSDRPVNHSPEASDSAWEQCCVLVLRLHDDSESLETPEVFGERERDTGTAARKRGVGNRILLQLRDVCNSRVFNAPYLLGEFARLRHQRGFGIDAPTINAIRRTSRTQMREAAAVFDPAKQQGVSVGEPSYAGVEYAVDRIWPILAAEEGIGRGKSEQRALAEPIRGFLFDVGVFLCSQRGD